MEAEHKRSRIGPAGRHRRALVVAFLAGHPNGATSEQIRGLLGLANVQHAQNLLRSMMDAGLVVRALERREYLNIGWGRQRRLVAIHRLPPEGPP